MKPTLLVMAAGMGSRFGGVKQLAKVGPNGETILDFSVSDARAAGIERVVMIVRTEIRDDVREAIETQHGDIDVTYICQDEFGPSRDKPWGTMHAVVSAAPVINGPFTVINADDYYGPSSFRLAAAALERSEPGRADLVTFELAKTVPPSGAVSRGLVQVEEALVTGIHETHDCEMMSDGTLIAGGLEVAHNTQCSMNLWCFHGSIMNDFVGCWEAFYAADDGSNPKSECQLPTEIGLLMDDGRLEVHTSASTETWIGITNPDDLDLARSVLAQR